MKNMSKLLWDNLESSISIEFSGETGYKDNMITDLLLDRLLKELAHNLWGTFTVSVWSQLNKDIRNI